MSAHIIRVSYQQPFVSTQTVGHFSVAAIDAAAAVSMIKRYYRDDRVQVEYIATVTR